MSFRPLRSVVLLVLSLAAAARADLAALLPELLEDAPHRGLSYEDIIDARIKAGEPVPNPEDVLQAWAAEGREMGSWTPLIHPDDEKPAAPVREPTAAQRQQLLDALPSHPGLLPDLLKYLPKNEEAARRIDAIYAELPAGRVEEQERRRSVRAWLYLHAGLHHGEVVSDAWQADWERYGKEGSRRDPSLHALQARDPQEFSSLLEILATHAHPGLDALAARLLLEHAKPGEGARWRDQLKWTAIDPSLSGEVRHIAVDALIACYWPDRDEWILSTLDLVDCGEISCYEKTIVGGREHWLPALVVRLNGHGQAARDHAAALLLAMSQDKPAAACLQPLLPWLTDAGWSQLPASYRLDLVLALRDVKLTESVSGLQSLLKGGQDEGLLSASAAALGALGDKASLPALQDLAGRCHDLSDRQRVIGGIDALGGYTPEAAVQAVEAFFSSPESEQPGRRNSSQNLQVDIGSYFSEMEGKLPAKIKERLEVRAHELFQDRPDLSTKLKTLAETEDFTEPAAFAKALAKQAVGFEQVRDACSYRREGRWPGDAFLPLIAQPGAVGGMAAALSSDAAGISTALGSGDTFKQAALLTLMSLLEKPLPVEAVAALTSSSDRLLAKAAMVYLSNSQDLATWTIWRRMNAGFPKKDDAFFLRMREELRTRGGRSDEPQEIIGMRSYSGWTEGENLFLAVYPDACLALRDQNQGRISTALVPSEKIQEIRDYLSKYRVDELPSPPNSVDDGSVDLYYHFAPGGGFSTLSIGEGFEGERGADLYKNLVVLLSSAVENDAWQVSYGPGSEILISDSGLISLWRSGNQLQALKDRVPERLLIDLDKKAFSPMKGGEDVWFVSHIRSASPSRPDPEPWPWLARRGNVLMVSGSDGEMSNEGLWLERPGQQAEKIASGDFKIERMTGDGAWCLATVPDRTKGAGRALVRVDVEKKQVLPITQIPPSFWTWVMYHSQPLHRYLIARVAEEPKEGSKMVVEYLLLNVATGDVEPLQRPSLEVFDDRGTRPLQPSGGKDEFWSVAVDGNALLQGTTIVRINSSSWISNPVWTIPGCGFQADQMWVDEEKEQLYACINGDLVRFDLKAMRVPAKQ